MRMQAHCIEGELPVLSLISPDDIWYHRDSGSMLLLYGVCKTKEVAGINVAVSAEKA